ncbi:MAG TPA: cell division topological specificity factor MinE [Stellaceae bacterium]|jgi:cell division topological specificity factor|nr:cell division topological specificity factor MinE [Stellaceae bacterium]
MSILSRLFGAKKPATASVAKERLQIVLAHERGRRDAPDFLPVLQQELLAVVAKYFHVQDEMIKIQVERSGETSVLEINVELDKARIKPRGEAAAKEQEKEKEEEKKAKETSSASET